MLDQVPSDSIVATQETFGPVAPVVGISSLEEAIALTNAQPFGLMAAIFTRDLAAGMRFADSVHMGLVNVNETTNYWEPHLPWGGSARSESGIGRVGARTRWTRSPSSRPSFLRADCAGGEARDC